VRPRPLASELVLPEELASVAEIAEMFGISRRTVHRYIRRSDFPAPLGRVAAGPIWGRSEVEAWGREHLPLPSGRPRKRG
jgi:predicted DNA-binding transcriptional regulator AlpA